VSATPLSHSRRRGHALRGLKWLQCMVAQSEIQGGLWSLNYWCQTSPYFHSCRGTDATQQVRNKPRPSHGECHPSKSSTEQTNRPIIEVHSSNDVSWRPLTPECWKIVKPFHAPSTTQSSCQANFNANIYAWLNIGHVDQNISVTILDRKKVSTDHGLVISTTYRPMV